MLYTRHRSVLLFVWPHSNDADVRVHVCTCGRLYNVYTDNITHMVYVHFMETDYARLYSRWVSYALCGLYLCGSRNICASFFSLHRLFRQKNFCLACITDPS